MHAVQLRMLGHDELFTTHAMPLGEALAFVADCLASRLYQSIHLT